MTRSFATVPTPRYRRAVTSMVTTEVVRHVAETLSRIGVDVMPVKGALLQHWLYDDPADRPMTDVDVLIRPSSLEDACAALIDAGYQHLSRSSIGARIMRTPLGLALDLHPRLFDEARYRLTTASLFARSTEDDQLFGVRVRLPAKLDAYAHLVGKFGSDHGNAASAERLDEIVRMGRQLGEHPQVIAGHLDDVGMRRVARYVLPLAADAGDPRARRTFAALPQDPVGRATVSIARHVLRSPWSAGRMGAVGAHLLNHSLLATSRSGVRALLGASDG